MNRKRKRWPSDRRNVGLYLEAKGSLHEQKGECWPSYIEAKVVFMFKQKVAFMKRRAKVGLRREAKVVSMLK